MGGDRARILLAGLFCWAFLVMARHGWLAFHERERLLAAGAELAWRSGAIPAMRGRILDRDGLALAWTERHYELWLNELPPSVARRGLLEAALANLRGAADSSLVLASGRCLRPSLRVEDLPRVKRLLAVYPELAVRPRLQRVAVDYPTVRQRLGQVAIAVDGIMTGCSGWELRHDRRLRGQDGAFLVMCDRHGNWLPGTWRETVPMVPGREVRIEASLAELCPAATTAAGGPDD